MKIELIERGLKTKYLGRKIVYKDITGSTNDDAKRMAAEGEGEGCVVITEQQTCGRGRMQRKWVMGEETSVALSMILRPDIGIEKVASITTIVALSIINAIEEIYNIKCDIKWPNDIFFGGRKLGGILAESSVSGNKVNYVIIGFGINVNDSNISEELKEIATSIKICTGIQSSREKLLSYILNKFELDYENFRKFGFKHFFNEVRLKSCVIGKDVSIISGVETIFGNVIDIDEEGNLILRLVDGGIKRIIYGDVSLRIKTGY